MQVREIFYRPAALFRDRAAPHRTIRYLANWYAIRPARQDTLRRLQSEFPCASHDPCLAKTRRRRPRQTRDPGLRTLWTQRI